MVIMIAGLYGYLRNADLTRYQDQIEAFASDKLGHDLRIGGRFDLHFGSTTTLVAEDVVLVNADWPGESQLIRVGELTFVFDTWSVLGRPFIVEELSASDIQVSLLRAEDGDFNWVSAQPRPVAEDSEPVDLNRIAFHTINLGDVTVDYDNELRPGPIRASIEELVVQPDENDVLDLDLRGSVNDLPLWADGKAGPWRNFVDGLNIFSDLDVTLGHARLSVEGTVENLRTLEGVEINAILDGPDIGRALEQLLMPPFAEGEFEVTANIERFDAGHQVRIDGNLGQIEVFASGAIDSLLLPHSVKHDFNINGPDASFVAAVLGIDGVPAERFQVSGDYSREGPLLGFADTLLQIGDNFIELDGKIDIRTLDTDFGVAAQGPDFSAVGPFIDTPGLPAEAFTVSGRVRKQGRTWQADSIEADIGANHLSAHGEVEVGSGTTAAIEVEVSGPDISFLEDFTDMSGIPARPYDIGVVMRSHPDGVLIEQGRGVFGESRLEATGVIAVQPGLSGTRGSLRATGPELRYLSVLADVPHLPSGPFEIAGDIEVIDDALLLDGVSAAAGGIEGTASGRVATRGGNAGHFQLDLNVGGPDIAVVPDIEWLEKFAGDAFRLEGSIAYSGEEIAASNLSVSLGDFDAMLNGTVVGPGQLIDMSVAANAEGSGILRKLAGLEYLPDGKVAIDGKLEKTADEIIFSHARVTIGDYGLSANGSLHLRPRSNDSDLIFSLSGPSLLEAARAGGLAGFPDKPFNVSGQFRGTPSGFRVSDFVAEIGDNDLSGEFTANLEGKPAIVGMLSSRYLDISEALVKEEVDAAETEEGDSEDRRYFSDEPLDTSWLQIADLDLEISVDHLVADAINVTDVEIGIELQDGALSIDPFYMRDTSGSVDAGFRLGPSGDVYTMQARAVIDNVHIGVLVSEDADISSLPLFSGEMEIAGNGTSIRSILGASDGHARLRQGPGRIKELFGPFLFRDLISQVIGALNIRRERGFLDIECGFYDGTIEDGVLTMDRVAVQTDRITMVASGTIRLRSERLDITFRIKPREGIGVSLAGLATSFISVGGTLANPSISLDPGRSAATTGAAVATGGLSLLARGLWDRLSAEKSICKEFEE